MCLWAYRLPFVATVTFRELRGAEGGGRNVQGTVCRSQRNDEVKRSRSHGIAKVTCSGPVYQAY